MLVHRVGGFKFLNSVPDKKTGWTRVKRENLHKDEGGGEEEEGSWEGGGGGGAGWAAVVAIVCLLLNVTATC